MALTDLDPSIFAPPRTGFAAPMEERYFPRQRRSQQIAEDLKQMIASGQLGAGKRIPTEAEMCRHYGVSRTTVREALQALRSNGVLDVTPGRGSFVRKPDPSPMLKELALVLSACGVSAAEVQALHQLLFRGVCEGLAQSPTEARQALYQHMVNPQASATENVALENRWHLGVANLGHQALVAHMVHLLLHFTQAQRVLAFESPAYVEALAQAQLRVTKALCENDMTMVVRLLPGVFNSAASHAHAA